MLDSADEIAKKIRKAKTDPDVLPAHEGALEGRPEAANLLGIYAALAEQSVSAAVGQFAGQQFSALKEALAELAIAKIARLVTRCAASMLTPARLMRFWPMGRSVRALWLSR